MYGPPAIVNAVGSYVYTSSAISPDVYAAPVRQALDPVQIRITNELSEVYYTQWKHGLSYPYGDWDVLPTPEATKRQFNLLCGLVHTMGDIAFHYVNVSMGTIAPLETYWFIDNTPRFHVGAPLVGDGKRPAPEDSDGAPVGPVDIIEMEPLHLAKLDDIEWLLGKSTRGIRDYFILGVRLLTGVDLTGRF